MSGITTHILDIARGRPAAGVAVSLARRAGDGWTELATSRSDTNGRVANLLPGDMKSAAGTYRLRFDTGAYFAALGVAPFHPFVEIMFEIRDSEQYHLPLRWAHVITGVAWIGTSFYFNWLNSRLTPPLPERREPGVAGELWSVHGGGFYRVVKSSVAPGELPRTLQWYKWEAYATSLTGFALLVLVYYLGAASFLVDPRAARLSPGAAVGVGVATLIVSWLVYDALCRSALGARPLSLRDAVPARHGARMGTGPAPESARGVPPR